MFRQSQIQRLRWQALVQMLGTWLDGSLRIAAAGRWGAVVTRAVPGDAIEIQFENCLVRWRRMVSRALTDGEAVKSIPKSSGTGMEILGAFRCQLKSQVQHMQFGVVLVGSDPWAHHWQPQRLLKDDSGHQCCK